MRACAERVTARLRRLEMVKSGESSVFALVLGLVGRAAVSGCFGGSAETTLVDLRDADARLINSGGRVPSAETLTLAEARELVRRVQAVLARPDEPPTCWSTTKWSASLAWSCGDGPRHTLVLETTRCGPVAVDITGGETRARRGPPAYSRVHALLGIASTPHGAPDAGR